MADLAETGIIALYEGSGRCAKLVDMFLRRRWPSVLRPASALVVAVSTVLLGAATVSAQEQIDDPGALDPGTCIGTVTASLAAESLPTGRWSAHGACLTADSFFEFSEGPVLAKAAVSEVVYEDGHDGRVAAGVLTLGNGLGLGIVGVEDAATGLIKWSAVLDEFRTDGDQVSVSGDGVAVFPIERATVSATLTGTGTDVKPFLDGWDDDPVTDDGAEAEDEPTSQAGVVDDTSTDGGSTASDPTGGRSTGEAPDPDRSEAQDPDGAVSGSSDTREDRPGTAGGDGASGSSIGGQSGRDYEVIEGSAEP